MSCIGIYLLRLTCASTEPPGGERWVGGGGCGGSVPFPRVMAAPPSKLSSNLHKWARPQGYLFARKISYRGHQTRWVATNRIKEKGGPADTGLVHWACCSRRYRVTIKSSVGGDGGRVSRELFGKRRWKKFKSSKLNQIALHQTKIILVIPY